MNRRITALLLITLLMCLTACGSKPAEQEQTAPPTYAGGETTEPTTTSAPADADDQDSDQVTQEDETFAEDDEGWFPAAPNDGSAPTEPREPEEKPTENEQPQDKPQDQPQNQPEQPSEPSDPDYPGGFIEEDCTPWG